VFPIRAPKPLDYISLQVAGDLSAYTPLPYPLTFCFSPPRAVFDTNLSVMPADQITPSLVDSSSHVVDVITTVVATTYRIVIAGDAYDHHLLGKMEST